MRGLPLLTAFALTIAACSEPAPMITVSEAYARATPSSAAVYFTMINSGGPDRLTAVTSAAGPASLHETGFDGSIMRMRAIEGGIAVPAGGKVRLSAMGKHVMVTPFDAQANAGKPLQLTLTFERQGAVTITAPLRQAR